MKAFFATLAVICLMKVLYSDGSLHASCKIKWGWAVNCSIVNEKVVSQIKKWSSKDNCKHGGEKCLYTLEESSPGKVTAKHTTPKAHYVDDLSFTFTTHEGSCDVQGYSRSELWYAILDYGTNYCNLHNLITGSGLDKEAGYSEKTSDAVCTQYSSANCDKY